MDGLSTAIVVLIFVATMLSSFGGNQGYNAPALDPQQEAAFEATLPQVPDYAFLTDASASFQQAIQTFVSKYRNNEEAQAITTSIMRYAQQYDVNPKLVAALMARESRFNPQAVSSSGAVGLGQLLPSTCQSVSVDNPYDIDQNARGTVRYLTYLLERFKNYQQRVPFAIAGYLEGPNAVERNQSYSSHTASYIKDILNYYQQI